MSNGIPFVRHLEFEYGKVERLSPLVRRVIARNPSSFTFYGTGTYIIGAEGSDLAVIDPGPLLDDHVEALIAAVAGEKVSHILITHTHIDHSPAAAPFKKAVNAPTYGFGPHGAGRPLEHMRIMEGGDRTFNPDHKVTDGDIIEGDGWTIEAVHTPGHTSNHLCFALKEESLLFSGDHVMGWNTSVISPPDGDMKAYVASLSRLLERDEKTYWPTHGPAITDPKTHVQALINHRIKREKAIIKALERGKTTIPEIVSMLYFAVPRNLHPAAGHTVLAHLIQMKEAGQITCEGAPSSDSIYGLVSGVN